jgi:hypothetical protein
MARETLLPHRRMSLLDRRPLWRAREQLRRRTPSTKRFQSQSSRDTRLAFAPAAPLIRRQKHLRPQAQQRRRRLQACARRSRRNRRFLAYRCRRFPSAPAELVERRAQAIGWQPRRRHPPALEAQPRTRAFRNYHAICRQPPVPSQGRRNAQARRRPRRIKRLAPKRAWPSGRRSCAHSARSDACRAGRRQPQPSRLRLLHLLERGRSAPAAARATPPHLPLVCRPRHWSTRTSRAPLVPSRC